jgi:hypothetical protein
VPPPQSGLKQKLAVMIVQGDKVKYTIDNQDYFVTEVTGGPVKKKYTLCKSVPCDTGETPIENVEAKHLQKAP